MKWCVYKTTNTVNGKIYVGVSRMSRRNWHSYLGSGTLLLKAVKKYGPESFTRVVLSTHKTAQAAYAVEARIVTEQFASREDTYNLKTGGRGSILYSTASREKMAASHRGKKRIFTEEHCRNLSVAKMGHEVSEPARRKIGAAGRGRDPWNKGKTGIFSEEQLEATRARQKNRVWINDGASTKFVMSDELDRWLNMGWTPGRIYRRKGEGNESSVS